jgi:hypothetical protein
MANEPVPPDPDALPEPVPGDDVFEGLVLDENFIRGGAYEPPHRTRAAIGKSKADPRNPAPLRPVEDLDLRRNRSPRKVRASRKTRSSRKPGAVGRSRRDLASWLPLTAAIIVVALLLIFHR